MAIRTTYKYKCDLDKGTLETTLRNSLMQSDALADAFAVTVQRNGSDVDISGMTVYGYLYANATKTTVPLKGTISGSTARVILSEDCYAVPGYASLMIQLHDGDVRHTVLKVDFVVTRSYKLSAKNYECIAKASMFFDTKVYDYYLHRLIEE